MKVYEGQLNAKGSKFTLVVARFNSFISERLVSGAMDCLMRHGCAADDISMVWVPGSFEIPLVAKKIAQSNKTDAVICLGAVIRGDTPHFDYVAAEVSKGVAQVALTAEIPVIFGVLTTDTLEQAVDRAGAKAGNKGSEAALCAIEMVSLMKQIG